MHPRAILGGSWDIITTYNWDITLLIIGVTHLSPYGGIISRVVIPVISSCQVSWASKYAEDFRLAYYNMLWVGNFRGHGSLHFFCGGGWDSLLGSLRLVGVGNKNIMRTLASVFDSFGV